MRSGEPVGSEGLQKSRWEATMLTGHSRRYTMVKRPSVSPFGSIILVVKSNRLYLSIKEWLKEAIAKGDYKPGNRIPSEFELMRRFNVARSTVRQALNELALEGWVYRVQGKGTYVAGHKYHQTLSRLTSFTEDMHHFGLTTFAKLLKCVIEPPTPIVCDLLKIHPSDLIIHIERIRYAGDLPMAINVSILPYKFVPNIEKMDLEHTSLYYLLENHYKLPLGRAEYLVEPIIADARLAKLLKIKKGAPLLHIDGTVFLKNGVPIELTTLIYRGDKYKFSILAIR